MKKSFYFMASAALLVMGCNVKSSDDIKKETDDVVKKNQQTMDELTSSFYYGGQPGKIRAMGIIVKKTADKTLLDERITIEQTGGQGNKGVSRTNVTAENKAELIDVASSEELSKVSELKTYANLGCTDLAASDISGLTEEKVKAISEGLLNIRANKIFVCGANAMSERLVTIIADQLILKDAALEVKSYLGSVSVLTNKLILLGKNNLKTIGVDMSISVLKGPSLDLLVQNEIHGEGALALQAIGANCVEAEKK